MDNAKIRELAKGGKQSRPPQGDNTEIRTVEGILTPEDMAELRELARQNVVEEYKAAERKVVLQRLMDEERGKVDPEEDRLDVTIDLPGHSACIKINMKPYWHGVTYNVPVSIYRTIQDVMAQAWKHENVVGNVNAARYRPVSRTHSISARTLATTTRELTA